MYPVDNSSLYIYIYIYIYIPNRAVITTGVYFRIIYKNPSIHRTTLIIA